MATQERERLATVPLAVRGVTNGAALAAYLSAGIGAFAMGFIVLLNEMGLLTVRTLYEPAGGVSGRTSLAIVVWVVAWAVLHVRWKDRDVDPARVGALTLILVALGILGTFPPFWGLVS